MLKENIFKKLQCACLAVLFLLFVGVQIAGAGWTQMTSNTQATLYGVWGTSATNVYAVGTNGTIMRYDGTAWTAETSGTTNKLNAVWGLTETNIYAVGEEVLLHKVSAWSKDALADYKDPDADYSQMTLTAVHGMDASHIYAGFSGGYLFWFDGTGWTNFQPEPPTSYMVAGIWPFTSTNIYLARRSGANDFGAIHRFEGGDRWLASYQETDLVPSCIWATAPDNIYAAGTGGSIINFNGSSWLGVSSAATKNLNALYGSSATNIFAVGKEGTIVHNKGAGFVAENFNTLNDLFGVWAAPDGTAFAVGTDGMILKYTPDAASTTTTVSGGSTTTVPGGTTTTTPGSGTTTTVPGGVTTSTSTTVAPGEVGADFIGSPLTGKAPLAVQFTNLSGGDIATYLWQFGDGGTSTEKNPSHVYEKRGKYSVLLTVIGTDATKQATKTRDSYINVKSICAIGSSLNSRSQIETLQAMRDASLDSFSGALLTAIYYRNTAEVNSLLDEHPELRARLRALVADHINIFEKLLQGEPVTVSADVLADAYGFFDELKAEGSIALQNDIDFIITGMQNGYFLDAMGISLE